MAVPNEPSFFSPLTPQKKSPASYLNSPEDVIRRMRLGESHLRDFLIEYHWNYVLAMVSKTIGRSAHSTDEFSVGLLAFNEAIDDFDESRQVAFLSFAGLVINRRVIDHIRKNSRYSTISSFTTLEEPSVSFTDRLEIQEEIMEFRLALLSFGITLEDLIRLSPKHADTRLLCITIARKLADSQELSQKLQNDKKLPIANLLELFPISRKTIENHRKYIIAIYLILCSDMEIIKGYGAFILKGVV